MVVIAPSSLPPPFFGGTCHVYLCFRLWLQTAGHPQAAAYTHTHIHKVWRVHILRRALCFFLCDHRRRNVAVWLGREGSPAVAASAHNHAAMDARPDGVWRSGSLSRRIAKGHLAQVTPRVLLACACSRALVCETAGRATPPNCLVVDMVGINTSCERCVNDSV